MPSWTKRTMMALLATLGSACATPGAPPPQAADTGAERSNPACPRAEMFGPVQVAADLFQRRNGAAATKFAQLATSRELPLEECGIQPALERLATLQCDDGSNPFDMDRRAAHASRLGSVGTGGRCDSMIDEYEVACPEKSYKVFVDSYLCPAK